MCKYDAIVYKSCNKSEFEAAEEDINRIIQEMYDRGYSNDRVRLIESNARSKAVNFLSTLQMNALLNL